MVPALDENQHLSSFISLLADLSPLQVRLETADSSFITSLKVSEMITKTVIYELWGEFGSESITTTVESQSADFLDSIQITHHNALTMWIDKT